MPCISQRSLCQLRCDMCICLETYKVTIGTAPYSLYPICRSAPHTSKHFFDCPASPTDLNFLDLWKHPCEALAYLRALASFNNLPPNPSFQHPPRSRLLRPRDLRSENYWQTNQQTNQWHLPICVNGK
jgi:hypothetical protein